MLRDPACGQRICRDRAHVQAANILLAEVLAVAAYDPTRVESDDLISAVTAAGSDGRHVYQTQVTG